MYKTLLGTAVVAGCLAVAQEQSPSQTPKQVPERSTAKTAGESNRAMNQTSDKKFAMDAAMGGMAEVELGKLAADTATHPDVKQFAQRMVEDHGKANDELK